MTTKVIFRVDARAKDDPEVIAFFPALAGDMNPYRTCQGYVHNGQHVILDAHYSEWTRPATEDEYRDLYNELVNVVGYDDLKVYKRSCYADLQARIKQTS